MKNILITGGHGFLGSYIALTIFNIHASYLVLFLVIITGTIILKFDKALTKQYRRLFRTENKISAKVFDTLSNITTVIILRVEDLLSKAIFRKVMSPYKLFMKNNALNEWKWFTISVCTSLMIVSVLFSFIYFSIFLAFPQLPVLPYPCLWYSIIIC